MIFSMNLRNWFFSHELKKNWLKKVFFIEYNPYIQIVFSY